MNEELRTEGMPRPTLHRQIENALAARIAAGEWRPGMRLPAERALCVEYGVSRITVRAALKALERQGLLASRQGRGTFVAMPRIEHSLGGVYSFSEEIRRRGMDSRTQVLEFALGEAAPAVRERLGLDVGEQVFRLVRLRQIGADPFAWECSHIPFFLAPMMNRSQVEQGGLYATIRALSGCVVDRVEESFEAVDCPPGPARLLGAAEGAATLRVERVALAAGRRVEYCESLMRSDKYRYKVVLD